MFYLLGRLLYNDYHQALKQAKTQDKENYNQAKLLNCIKGKMETTEWKHLKCG